MANRCTEAEVLAIAPGITITPLLPFITAANFIVSDINDKCGKSFSEDRLKEIECWLSAHFAYMGSDTTSGTKKSESIAKGDYSVSFSVASVGEGITGTPYGQTANLLSEGCLAEWDKRQSQAYASGPNG